MKLIVFLTILTLWTPPPWPRPVHVVFVNTATTTWTDEAQASALLDVKAGLGFWDLLPVDKRVQWTIADTAAITPTSTTAGDWSYTEPWRKAWVDATIFLVPGNGRGVAYPAQRIMIVPVTPFGNAANLRPVLAHEWGHLGYGLPDRYLDGSCAPDIMCEPVDAYVRGYIGCDTRADLDLPCSRVFVPVVSS